MIAKHQDLLASLKDAEQKACVAYKAGAAPLDSVVTALRGLITQIEQRLRAYARLAPTAAAPAREHKPRASRTS
ncbi:MAG TPA: hypothetical protein PKI20_13470 [Verrucomicrobiota bacterium]|nr:hypothetical protein [Verrucomicrobiota bacterium]HQL78717.1 hypothetical protein [Verrucomicrobiota bacterium]